MQAFQPPVTRSGSLILFIKNSLHLVPKYARIFVRGHYLFREAKTVSFEEKIMPADKYPSIFPRQTDAIVFIILHIFFAARAVFKIGEYHSDIPQV